MSSFNGPSNLPSGLILDLDLGNRKSYQGAAKNVPLLDSTSWTVGTGGVGVYSPNGTIAENQRLVDSDPFGNQNIVWQSNPVDGNADGGWETSFFSVDTTKTYRFSVWVRRTSVSTAGTFYMGCRTDISNSVIDVSTGSANSNPYWHYSGLGNLAQNQWYLFVGHIMPTNSTGTTMHPNTGYYQPGSANKQGGNLGGNIVDGRFPTGATVAMSRVYHFYSGDPASHLQFAYNRVEVLDGTELSMQELVSSSYTMVKDMSGYNNHHYLNSTVGTQIPFSGNPNKLALDGSSQFIGRVGALTGVTNNCSVIIWYSTTDTKELWVEGQSTLYYIGASEPSPGTPNYYQQNAGTPTYYVDLNVTTNPMTPINYRNGAYHMFEAKGVDFSAFTQYQWFGYPSGWQLAGNVSCIQVYNRVLTAAESTQIFNANRGRYGI
jgi:hypothetical protein